VFTVSVGNLPPGASVLIKITYVAELVVEGENIVFSLPGNVAPWKQETALDQTTQTDVKTTKVKKQSGELSVQVAVEMPFNIKTIESPTHKIKLKKTASMATVELCPHSVLGAGFTLLVGLSEIHVPRMWVEEDKKGHHACMLTFYPEFEVDEISDNEIIFLLDLSNSMKDCAENAKKVLLLLLHHLPTKCHFNVLAFGGTHEAVFPVSVMKNKDTLSTAQKFVQERIPNMGSTDVWRPLRALQLLSETSPTSSSLPGETTSLPPRSVFLVSDGHVTDEGATLSVIRQALRNCRLFTFGVSSTANRHFLRAMARVGAGCEEFFDPKTKSRWERKVRGQLAKAFQPALTALSVEWQQFDDNAPKPVQAPQEMVSLFSGSRQVVYGFVPHCKQATLKAKIGGKEVQTMVSTTDLAMTQGRMLHQLTARAIIRDWTDGCLSRDKMEHEIVKKERKSFIINISKDYSIVSQFTSFVAIEEREKDEVFDQRNGPAISDLVAKETVDKLAYMGWDLDESADPVKEAEEALEECQRSGDLEKRKRLLRETETVLGPTHPLRFQVFKNLTTEMLSKNQPKEAYEVAMAMQSQLELTYTSDAARYLEDLKQFIATTIEPQAKRDDYLNLAKEAEAAKDYSAALNYLKLADRGKVAASSVTLPLLSRCLRGLCRDPAHDWKKLSRETTPEDREEAFS
jgi:poly [ADP-ribose] polymerase